MIKRAGGKVEVLEFIKNKDKLAEPLMLNFAGFSKAHIKADLAPDWLPHVSMKSELTPLENAKANYFGNLTIMPIGGEGEATVNELLEFCYPEDAPSKALFAVAQNGGLVVLYEYAVVWFKEPDGSECWARMS